MPLLQFWKLNNFILLQLICSQKISNFVSLSWKLHNRYCHSENATKQIERISFSPFNNNYCLKINKNHPNIKKRSRWLKSGAEKNWFSSKQIAIRTFKTKVQSLNLKLLLYICFLNCSLELLCDIYLGNTVFSIWILDSSLKKHTVSMHYMFYILLALSNVCVLICCWHLFTMFALWQQQQSFSLDSIYLAHTT